MALVKCKECKAEVSNSANKCPKCGVQIRKLKRGFFGQLAKWTLIAFNLFMIWALFAGLNNVGEIKTNNEFEEIGVAIGTGLGVSAILIIWVLGDIILGLWALLTRPK